MPNTPHDMVAQRYARNTAIAATMIAVIWHMTNDLNQMLSNWDFYRSALAVLAAWSGCAVVGAVAAPQLFRTSGMVRHPWLLASVPLAAVAVVAIVCGNSGIVTPANWAWGAVGWLGVLLMWNRPIASLLTFVGLTHAITLAALIIAEDTGRVTISRFLSVVAGTAILQVGFAAGASALKTAAGWIAAASAAQAETATRRAAAAEIHKSRQQRYRTLQQAAADLLSGLAAGRSDPSDPGVRRRCATEAGRLRRLLVEADDLPDPLVHELRAGADVAERRGVVVDLVVIGSIPQLPLDMRQALTDPPIEVLAMASNTARVTVVGSTDRVIISIVADTDPGAAVPVSSPIVGLAHHREGDRLWIETTWHALSPSP